MPTAGRALRTTLALLITSSIPAIAHAQSSAPVRQATDGNGVDVIGGTYNVDRVEVSVGPKGRGGLGYMRNVRGTASLDSYTMSLRIGGGSYTVSIGGSAESFTASGGGYVSDQGTGSTLVFVSTDIYEYTGPDGTKYTFDMRWDGNPAPTVGRATQVVYPTGETITFGYNAVSVCNTTDIPCHGHTWRGRLQGINNSTGYRMHFDYASDTATVRPDLAEYSRVTRITGFKTSMESCATTANSCSFTNSWPHADYGQSISGTTITTTVTDPLSNVWRYTTDGVLPQLTGIKPPTSATDTTTIAYDGNFRVASVSDGTGTWNYSYSDSGTTRTTTVTDPLSHTRVVVSDLTKLVVNTDTDALSHTTSYTYDSKGRATRVTLPEGNYTNLIYDSRGNVTEVRQVSKTAGTPADLVTTTSYDSTCTYIVKCNQPNSVTDPLSNTTDYTYDTTHGGVLTVTAPAATGGGTRPQTRFGYTASSGIYRLTSVSECQTTSSCAAGSDEVKTVIAYTNFLPTSITKGSGDGALSVTTAYTYDDVGNLLTVDGPLSGTADTTRYRYDIDRRPIGVAGPDPDGGGSLKHRAARATYNGDSRLTQIETGNVNSQSDSDWSAFSSSQQHAIAYDARGLKVQESLSAGGTTYQVTQFSYDAARRPECAAQRMNAAIFGSLPGACTLGTAGSYGPDRIVKNLYDSVDRVTTVRSAYGTADQADIVTSTYTDNGLVATVTDAETNKTSYSYDGFDRLWKTFYPDTTKGAGTSSTTDYVQLTYDANGNVTSRRLRDGTSIGYTFDALDRTTAKDLPGSEPDVAYTYDLLGRTTGASQTGNALTFTYDALGRNLTQGGPLGTVSMAYDLAGRRTSLTWPDSFYVSYDHLVTGEVSVIRENGATSGVGVLATYGYDDLGRRASLTYGNGTVTSYGFDGVSRLSSLAINLDGSTTTNDVTTSFAYSPANQIVSQTGTNDLYAWDGHYNVARGYTSNGINQLTAAGATSLGYDARGNITSSGSDTYGYSSENLLTSTTVSGVSASYEYDPLLRLYKDVFASPLAQRMQYDGTDVIAVYNNAGAVLQRYVFGPGADEPLVEYSGAGTGAGVRSFLHADERGSIVVRSNESGAGGTRNAYDEYGVHTASNTSRFQYTGQVWMSRLGMYYYKARMYSPTLGRFMQTDPIGYGDGMNLYRYVGNDPINRADPTGLAQGKQDKPIPPKPPNGNEPAPIVVVGTPGLHPPMFAPSGAGTTGNTTWSETEGITLVGHRLPPSPPPDVQPSSDLWQWFRPNPTACRSLTFTTAGFAATAGGAEVVAVVTAEATPPALLAHAIAIGATATAGVTGLAAIYFCSS